MEPIRVIFVCLGNICRSPMAKGLFLAKLKARGVSHLFEVESAGTSSYHVGESPDPGAISAARRAGVDISSDRSSQVTPADMGYYDVIIALDRANRRDLHRLAAQYADRVHFLREFDPEKGDLDVPDPWGGGSQSFNRSRDIIDRSVEGLLDFLLESNKLT